MKVLLVNKFFYRRAGAETAFFNLAELLESRGHAVVPFSTRHPESLPSPFAADFVAYFELDGPSTVLRSLRAARNFLYSRDAERRIERIIDKEKPDVAHLHNVYHHLSPSVLRPLRKRSIPTVMTLHDYKVVCPAYTLFSGGRICERCRGGRYAQAAFRRCAKGRSGRSLLLAAEAYLHGPVLRSYAGVDLFLSPSRFLLEKIRELGFGLPAEVVPNVFFADRFRPAANASGGRIVYAGRLAPEKGVAAFLRAVGDIAADVRIIGTGPDEARLKALARRASSAQASTALCVADLEFDPALVRISRGGRRITLPPIPLKLLETLMRASPRVVRREELERAVWGDAPPDSDALRAHLYTLRTAVDAAGEAPLVHTLRGIGYRIAPPEAD